MLSFMISVVHLLHNTELNQSSNCWKDKVFVSTTCFNLVVSVFFCLCFPSLPEIAAGVGPFG